MIDIKNLKIKGYYFNSNVQGRVVGAAYYTSEETEDDFIDIYPASNDNQKIVVCYHKGCEMYFIDVISASDDIEEQINKRIEA